MPIWAAVSTPMSPFFVLAHETKHKHFRFIYIFQYLWEKHADASLNKIIVLKIFVFLTAERDYT